MSKGISNTQRTLKLIRARGWKADIVERWLNIPGHPGGGKRKDLFGIIDIIAMTGSGIVGVQSCGSSFSEHDKKILQTIESEDWISNGATLMLIGWRKILKNRKGKMKYWTPRTMLYAVENDKIVGYENGEKHNRE
ncbi:MAG TPA: hypothetical protein VMV56_07715 [Williamwhitmania sp.]|nr:hypothetical protein [Williamwhitmania sp.]